MSKNNVSNIDSIKMTREIRDMLYEKYKHLSLKDYAEILSQEAEKGEFGEFLTKCNSSKT